MRLIWLAAALLATPSPAQPPTAEAPAPAAVRIPFNPPLGEALQYRQTIDETRNGRPVHTQLDLTITFARDSDGYVMTATYLLPAGMSPNHPAIAILLRPLSLRVSAQGEITGIVDEPAYWAGLESILDGLSRNLGADGRGQQILRDLFASMRNLPEESRLALVARNVSPLIEYASTEMRPNEVLQGSVGGETAFGPIVQAVSTRLTGASDSDASVEAVYRLAPGQLEAIMRNLETRFGVAPQARNQALNELMVERRDTFRISLATGLTEHHESVITASGDEGGRMGSARRTLRLARLR